MDGCPRTAGIYYWRNNVNGKGYVGQSIDICKRLRGHKSNIKYKRKSEPFYLAIYKYGADAFTCYKVMDCCPSYIALNYWEAYWVKELDTFGENGYNQTAGGSNCGCSLNTKTKIGNANRGRQHTDEARRKISEAGKLMSKHSREKIRMANIGRKRSPETRERIRLSKGIMSDETRARISAGHIGRVYPKQSDAAKAKIAKGVRLKFGTLWKEFFIFE
jgi:group I intron endonuclease